MKMYSGSKHLSDRFDLSDFCEKHIFYKLGYISGPKRSPDMILSAFDVKFDETKDGMPPETCRP